MSATELAPEPGTALTANATRAFGWSFINTVCSRLGTMVIGIVLARLLGPAEFGTFAVATVALIAVLSFNELGVSLAIVRWPGDPRVIAPTVATVSLVFSTLLTAALVAVAPAFSRAMGDPSATPVLQVMAVAVLISGAVATPAALLQREFRQRRRLVIDQVSTWLGSGLSLGLALAGLGAMSLAAGRVVGAGVGLILFLALSPTRVRLGWDRTLVRPLLRFGLPLAAASLLVFVVGFIDQLVVGSTLGSVALGYYLLAFNLAGWPVAIFSLPLRSVAPAMFARLRDGSGELNAAYIKVFRVLMAVTLPVCLVLAGAAEPIIRFVYGDVWLPAAEALRFLSVVAAARIFGELTYDYLVVLGRSRSILSVQAVWLVALVPALVLGSHWGGVGGVALGQTIVALAVVVPSYLWLLGRSGVDVSRLLRAGILPAVLAAGVGAAALVLSDTVTSTLWADVASGLLAVAVVAGLVYRQRGLLKEVRR